MFGIRKHQFLFIIMILNLFSCNAADRSSVARRCGDLLRPIIRGAAVVGFFMSLHAAAEEAQNVYCMCERTGPAGNEYLCTGLIDCCGLLLQQGASAQVAKCVSFAPEVFEVWLVGRKN